MEIQSLQFDGRRYHLAVDICKVFFFAGLYTGEGRDGIDGDVCGGRGRRGEEWQLMGPSMVKTKTEGGYASYWNLWGKKCLIKLSITSLILCHTNNE